MGQIYHNTWAWFKNIAIHLEAVLMYLGWNVGGGEVKGKINGVRTLFSASRGAHLLFITDWARLLNFMLLQEGRQSSARQACYLPSLSWYPFTHQGREEQVRVKCLAQEHNTQSHTGFELTTLGVGSSTAELRVHPPPQGVRGGGKRSSD